ncbi:McrC family protein [Bacillus arachidis]|uniref:McrC family protein n=1 Tax=Bacillus arachidis TaxID=2819290 RepID=A0ABS3P051_9BACI|nr:McrC family protein [Bacillus arachidis]MBO1626147.1 McrC family protein [Bacillus arachidis]
MKKKLVELREYDVITTNREISKDTGLIYLDKVSFSELESLILNFNEINEANAIDFLSLSSKRNVGKVIRAKNYVGVLQLNNGIQLQILPKVHGGTQEDSKRTFLKMLKALRDFPSKTFNESNLNTEKMPIFEIFIRLYIQEVQHLVKRGLKSAYYEVEDNLKVFKGKMNFSQQLKYNVVHKERFYVQYDEFGLNRAENRLIKSTLVKLAKESESTENMKELRKLLANFELVELSTTIEKDFAQVKIDRNSKDYETVLNWSKFFLRNQSFTTFVGTSFVQALLFPMDRVFEDYVGRNLRRMIQQKEWSISLQDRQYHLFEKQFALRPDIVLRNEVEQRTIIIDTKWKLLKNTPSSNYGISQADMYQMYAYAKKYGTNEIWLLYPINDEFKGNEEICFTSDDGVQVKVFFVDCHRIEESLEVFMKKCKI